MLFAEKSGNKILAQDLRRLIVPLFAFVVLRVHPFNDSNDKWQQSVRDHKQMIEVLKRVAEPGLAEQQVAHAIRHFGEVTSEVLRNRAPSEGL